MEMRELSKKVADIMRIPKITFWWARAGKSDVANSKKKQKQKNRKKSKDAPRSPKVPPAPLHTFETYRALMNRASPA